MRPPAWKGLLKAIVLDLAMIVLSRSKNAALRGERGSHGSIVGIQQASTGEPASAALSTGRRPAAPAVTGPARASSTHGPRPGTSRCSPPPTPALAEELARLSAAAGAAIEVALVGRRTRCGAWSTAPVVLVGADLASALVELAPAAPARGPGRRVVAGARRVVPGRAAGRRRAGRRAARRRRAGRRAAHRPRARRAVRDGVLDRGGRGVGRRGGDDAGLRARSGRRGARADAGRRPRPARAGLRPGARPRRRTRACGGTRSARQPAG